MTISLTCSIRRTNSDRDPLEINKILSDRTYAANLGAINQHGSHHSALKSITTSGSGVLMRVSNSELL